MTTIHSIALYPREEIASIRRRHASHCAPVGDGWPAHLVAGDAVRILDDQGWEWDAAIVSVDHAAETGQVRVLGDRRAQPFPAIDPEGWVRLPNVSGHAHVRSWRRGDIVRVGAAHYKVAAVKPLDRVARISYRLEPATAEQYAARPGRVSFNSERQAHEAVGTAVKTATGEWIHVKKVERSSFSGALGRDYTYRGVGTYVSAERARKLNDVHPLLLDDALSAVHGERATEMPAGAVELRPRNPQSTAATGTRVAVVDRIVYHERCGDPDQLDIWVRYVVRITDPELVRRAKAFIRRTK